MPTASGRSILVVLAALVVFVGAWLLRRGTHGVASSGGDAERAATNSEAELVTPAVDVARAEPSGPASESNTPSATPRAATGVLTGRVLLDASFLRDPSVAFLQLAVPERARDASATDGAAPPEIFTTVDLETTPRASASGRTRSSEPLFGSDFELRFEDLEPGIYELRLAAVSPGELDESGWQLAADPNSFCRVAGLVVVAGETARDPRLDPLDLRGKVARMRCTVVDGFGVARANERCRALASVVSQSRGVTDARGDVDFALDASAGFVEVELENHHACVTRSSLSVSRTVVVVPDRPVYVLQIESSALSSERELSIFVRESSAISGDSPLGRGAVWGRFEPSGDATVAPRRLGLHALEWRVKNPDGTTTTTLDPTQTLDVRASSDVQRVSLSLPAAVRAALR
ncbi:MAG: hypothetical protein IT453_02900 [Planctomycetes bacterium]|nr:hypothetical protein [Planctomycetota bacterium]